MIDELDKANSIITEFLALAKDRDVRLEPASLSEILDSMYPLMFMDAIRQGKYIKIIDHNLLDRLGTPFLTTKENRTGLGIAVCYSIASRHDAEIDVETGSTGTAFYVRFKTSSI